MKIKTIVVDDEPPALELMKTFVEQTPFLEWVAGFDNGLDTLDYLEKEKGTDLILLDIQMPGLSGMELAKIIQKMPAHQIPAIIFITAHSDYAIEGYKVNAVDYLLKPILFEDFYQAVHKVKSGKREMILAAENQPGLDYIFVKVENQMEKILLDEIRYIEGFKDYLKIHLQHRSAPVLSLMSMKKMESLLPETVFMRVHRSYIISINAVRSLNRTTIFLEDEKHIIVGDNFREAYDAFYKQWII